ncbi:mucin-2-like [Uloborus diversus]|uniref:mucin-2-like n=1 Tax=Uloborus diversus TaxID=327109 RepID=UPI002408F536|nr:mucin-2-like [Uloborus diversus]
MVVCNTSMLPMAPAACPMTPTAIHPFSSGLCPLSPVSAIPCNQRYPPTTILSAGPILRASTPIPCAPGLTTPPVIRCTASISPQSSSNSSDSPSDNPSNIIACNLVSSANIIPLSNGLSTLVPCHGPTIVQCEPKYENRNTSTVSTAIYTYSPAVPTSTIVPQRVLNGQSVLQCTPGVCQITPATVLPTGPLEICSIPSTPLLANTPNIYPPLQIPQNICTATAASPWKQSYGMEQVWQCEFRNFFSQFTPHAWMLLPVVQKPAGIWNANVDSAKVRFCCEDCGHGWTSMKGRVAFWFILNPATGEGVVCLKLYGQQCDRCKTGNYEPAMWYPEEVVKVLVNIYNRVGQVYYGFQQAPYHRARRPGKPRTPHNSDLCQACKDGVCAERR